MDLASLRNDQDFLNLPEVERAKVVESLVLKDRDFLSLSDADKVKVLNTLVGSTGKTPEPAVSPSPIAPSLDKAVEQSETGLTPRFLDFNPSTVALGTLISTVIGGAYGKFAKAGLGTGKGLATGGFEGALSSGVGEYIRSGEQNGNNEMLALGAELASPAALRSSVELVPSLWKTIKPGAQAINPSYQTTKIGEVVGETLRPAGKEVRGVELMKRQTLFGEQDLGPYPEYRKYTTETNEQAAQFLADTYGILVKEGELASRGVRDFINNSVSNAQTPFLKSASGITFLKELGTTKSITPAEKKAIRELLTEQMSSAPIDKQTFAERLNNSLQNTTNFKYGGVELGENARTILRKHFNTYLDDINNKSGLNYDALKNLEEAQFVATARDAIPGILGRKFSPKLVEEYGANIAKSPEAKKDFQVALFSYFRTLPKEQLVGAFEDLYPTLVRLKLLPREELVKLQRGVAKVKNQTTAGKVSDVSLVSLREGILNGVIPAELANAVMQQEKLINELENTQFTM